MAKNPSPDPSPTPLLFDRGLLLRRQRRAAALGPVNFLLERVVEDMNDRLAAVMRDFEAAADIWTPGEGLQPGLRRRLPSLARIAPPDSMAEVLPL